MRVEMFFGVEGVDEAGWRGIEPSDFPFFDLEFLRALERSGSIGDGSGWSPLYLVCENGGAVLGALCLYAKTDSYGEYIFDWEWARAYQRHGVPYYPKLVCAVPFTPATGPKLLLRSDLRPEEREATKRALFEEAEGLVEDLGASSAHALFVPEGQLEEFAGRGFAVRHSLQFHWRNRSYDAFSDYLAVLASKRRRQIERERRSVAGEGLVIERLTGEDIPPEAARRMYRFYLRTLDGKWGVPYLNAAFFDEVFRTMRDRILLVLARDGRTGRPLAGALNFFKGDTLYGRYWGAAEHRKNLHFELCYYQGIEFAIERGIRLFEAGAQGEHKLARGFLPTLTYSVHSIRHPDFRNAIERYIDEEKHLLAETIQAYKEHDPYK